MSQTGLTATSFTGSVFVGSLKQMLLTAATRQSIILQPEARKNGVDHHSLWILGMAFHYRHDSAYVPFESQNPPRERSVCA